jgi:hypothetical protein
MKTTTTNKFKKEFDVFFIFSLSNLKFDSNQHPTRFKSPVLFTQFCCCLLFVLFLMTNFEFCDRLKSLYKNTHNL